jgi:TRAP-type C4-dicarboxylate transport system permease small subunit
MAIFGGVLCAVIAALVTVSVTGRYLFSAPIPGDYDIVGIIAGCAVFAFLPYCQMIRGNVVVDFFTNNLGTRAPRRSSTLSVRCSTSLSRSCSPGGCITARSSFTRSNQQIAAFTFYRWWTCR